MNTSNHFFDPAQTVHFLSLFTYMNKLSDIFYSEQLLKEEDKHQQFPIINALYEHLHIAPNETEAKQQLVQRLLEGSELYGGQRNETLDMEYVNNTLDYIITNAVFAQSGNLYGYLAEIACMSTSLKLSAFKKNIFDHLSHLRQLKDDGDVSNLTQLATAKIAENLLWSLFPDPPHDMEIISVKYIYALAGYNLAKSAQMNLTNITFNRYLTLAMTIETSVIGDELPVAALQVFALPAMIYYAYNQSERFSQQTTKRLLKDGNFWSDAFLALFSYLNSTLEMIRQETLESNSLYQFHLAMSEFKNRTVVARDVLHKECKFNESYTESLIEDYKTYSASTVCYKGAQKLPNLEQVYEAQFHKIKEKYRLMEADFIRAAFDEFPAFRDLINSTQTIVYRSYPIPYDMTCNMCAPRMPPYHPNINFFAIKNQGEKEYYALEQNENNVTLLIQKDNDDFNKRVGLPKGRKLEISTFIKIFKREGEGLENFILSFAEMKAEEFRNKLFEYGYEKTSMEKFIDIVLAFIPFYHCVKYAKAGEQGLAALSCVGDIAGFIPLAGIFGVGLKVGTVVTGRFLLASGLTLKTFTLRQALLTTMTSGLREAAAGFNAMLTKVILTKRMFRHLSISVIRSLDPGFELVGKLGFHGSALLGKVINNALKLVSKKFPSLHFKYLKYESIWLHLSEKGVIPRDEIEILPEILNDRKVFRYIYPGGDHPFGPKYVHLSKGNAELRRMIGFNKEIPVISITGKRKILYRKVNLQTEEPFGLEMKLNKEGLLENVEQPFRQHIYKIKTEGFGGKGALLANREKSINGAANVVAEAGIGVSKTEAKTIVRHYMLAYNDPIDVDEIIEPGTELMNFDNFMNVDINKLLKEHKADPIMDASLNEYLQVPTFEVFALDWARTGRISEVYQDYFVNNYRELEKLLFGAEMDRISDYNVVMANEKIFGLYGTTDNMGLGVETVLNKYILDNALVHVKFEDYYALCTWINQGYKILSENPTVSLYLRNAFYRVAIRQSTDESLAKVLYHLEVRKRLPDENDVTKLVDKTVTAKNFIMSTSDDMLLQNVIQDLRNNFALNDGRQIFVHKMYVDSSHLTADVNEIIPTENMPIVILPGTSFNIQKVEEKIIGGFNVIEFELKNKFVAKEVLISRLMNEIYK